MPSVRWAAVGGSVTRRPSLTTTTVSVRPSEPEIRWEMSSAWTTAPSMDTIRSPACRPAVAAGVPVETAWTVVVAFPAEVMKRPVKRTRASTMLAAGPAPIAATRFHVGALQ